MTNTTGPDELYNLIRGLDVDGTTLVYLASCAAAWEADQTKIAIYEGRHPAQLGPDGREMSPRHRFTSDGICIRCGEDVESDTGCVEELRAALDRAANDLMLSEESFVTMRAKRDDVLSELRTTRAALSARDHAVDLAGINAEAANELERRAERAEAALERARELWIRWRDTICLFPQLEKFVEAADAALASGGAA